MVSQNIFLIGILLTTIHSLLALIVYFDAQSSGRNPLGYSLFVFVSGLFGVGFWMIIRDRMGGKQRKYARTLKSNASI